jgi:hypothetical protein
MHLLGPKMNFLTNPRSLLRFCRHDILVLQLWQEDGTEAKHKSDRYRDREQYNSTGNILKYVLINSISCYLESNKKINQYNTIQFKIPVALINVLPLNTVNEKSLT